METLLQALRISQLVLLGVTVYVTFDLWYYSRRQHALLATIALSLMFLDNILSFLVQPQATDPSNLIITHQAILPFIITLIWYIAAISSKTKVGK